MERLHIAFFGPTNSGKSTLVNAIAGQEVSLVSPVPGTTTDPVRKPIEIPGLGPCVLIDTAGLDDAGILGSERARRTHAVLDEADVAVEVLSMSQNSGHREQNSTESAPNVPDFGTLASQAGIPVIPYTRGESVESLILRIQEARPQEEQRFLTGDLVQAGDTVVLVMPQDSEAPKGRLILPQVQVIRELLDRGCTPLCCTPDSLSTALGSLRNPPALVITDSQAFKAVNQALPKEVPLTSFSILLAAAKADVDVFIEGAQAIDHLTPTSRVLIAEACTHVPDTEDIGRVKIPTLLRQRVAADGYSDSERSSDWGMDRELYFASEAEQASINEAPQIDIAAGNDFPENIADYDLIIHCGACVASRQLVRARTRKALLNGVPITNYGIALAKLQGMLERVAIPGSRTRKQSS